MKLLVATQNPGKLREYRRLLAALDITIASLSELNPGTMDVEETGSTFAENAILKAKAYARVAGMLTLADDSGLMVDALDGAPGIHSARYGGTLLDHAGKRRKLLAALDGIEDERRGATFVCVIAIAEPQKPEVMLVNGECRGRIMMREYDAGNGFGYDPIFRPDGFEHTFGQMTAKMKNGLSHRSIATTKAVQILQTMREFEL